MGMGKQLAAAAALALAIGFAGGAQAATECVLNGQGGDCRGPILVTDQITVSGAGPVVSSTYSASGSTTTSSSSYSSDTGCHGHYVAAPVPAPMPPAPVPVGLPTPAHLSGTYLPASFFVSGLSQGVGYGIGQGYAGGGGGGVVIISGGGGGTLARSPVAFRTPDFSNRFRRPAPPPRPCCKHH